MIERLDAIQRRYQELQDELIKPEVMSDIEKEMDFRK